MKTTFKINSATQQAANQKLSVVQKLIVKCGISNEQWANVLFEMGCSFVELNVSAPDIRDRLLKDKEVCFWDWWVVLFIEDDESLLNYPTIINLKCYQAEKARLITLMDVYNQFERFLNSNKKLNG